MGSENVREEGRKKEEKKTNPVQGTNQITGKPSIGPLQAAKPSSRGWPAFEPRQQNPVSTWLNQARQVGTAIPHEGCSHPRQNIISAAPLRRLRQRDPASVPCSTLTRQRLSPALSVLSALAPCLIPLSTLPCLHFALVRPLSFPEAFTTSA